ncbi:MAG TPA: flavodoxin domain-containing protein [Candidatus Hungatella pullicola]|nr:flavodoxin domain-containing protein [Candidatus Hungatella pullicola]
MKGLIVYGSQYGTTKRYAEKLGEIAGLPVISCEDVKDLGDYGLIIHLGGLYAGGVKGLKKTVKALQKDTKIVIVTVGLADVCDKENTDNIKKSISRQIPEEILNSAAVFHLRGGIDYEKLNFKHRTMMKLLYTKAKHLPENKKTAEVRAMIETFNQKVNFVDYHSLNPILEAIRQILIFSR